MKREGQIKVHSENIFPIIKKWLYSDKDIFLRELVSNACDAIKKWEHLKQMGEAPDVEENPRVDVYLDKEARTLSVCDNGLGMDEEEVEKYITQIAFSGAEEFIEKYKDKTDAQAGIIGHFGLGFYSAFMVSDTVEIQTLSYRENAKPVHWSSDGSATYEIEEGNRTQRGTTVLLHIAEDAGEFLEEYRIREMLRKYCQFMPYEIYFHAASPSTTEDHKQEEHPVNNTSPLWLKAPKDCTKEEYIQFYHECFTDFSDPLFWIHLNVDFPFNLKGILYFPKQGNKLEVMPGQIKLFNNQVYIADNIKEVVPEFLMLLKGVMDCPDLPLNVSRSFLQNDKDVAKISKHITKKVSDKLHSVFREDRTAFEGYWNDIAPFIKFGCVKEESFYEKVKDILLLETINGDYKTLEEYPKESDGTIFYVTDKNIQAQYIRMFQESGMNAAILDHMIDSHFISFVEYMGNKGDENQQKLKFARIDSDIAQAMKGSPSQEQEEQSKKLVDLFQNAMDDKDLSVKAEALKAADTPAVMLLSEYERRMQDMSALYGDMFGGAPKTKSTIVLNMENPIVQALPHLQEEMCKLVCRHIYDLAMISHKQLNAEEISSFIKRSVEILGIVAAPGENA